MGLIGILTMLKPMLVDYGYSMREIGIMSGIIGTSMGCAASFAAGFIVRRIGRNTSRILFACLTLVTAVYFYCLVTFLPVNIATLHLGITLLWASYGMSTIIVYTTSMDCVRTGYEGTDFHDPDGYHSPEQYAHRGAFRKISRSLGYANLFLIEIGIAVLSLIYIIIAFHMKRT
jgi:hypothetical protein